MGLRIGVSVAVALLALTSACGDDDDSSATDPASGSTGATSAAPSSSGTPSDPATPSESATVEPSPTTPSGPDCAEVWVRGERLARSYKGCTEGDTWVPADKLGCSSGQKLVRYQPHFWAVAGGEIHRAADLDSDPDYRAAIASCRG